MAKKSKAIEKGSTSASATLRHVRISPQKARLVVNLVKGKQVEQALQILRFSSKKGAALVEKLLRSAIVNARETTGADVDKLWVTQGWANSGRTIKRFMPRARGSANQILKKSSHITIVVGEP